MRRHSYFIELLKEYPSASQLPLSNRYEALGVTDEGCENLVGETSMRVPTSRSDQLRLYSRCSIKISKTGASTRILGFIITKSAGA